MLNLIAEALTEKTVDQYKVIEERYEILKRYLKEFFEAHYAMNALDIKVILNSIEPPEEVELLKMLDEKEAEQEE